MLYSVNFNDLRRKVYQYYKNFKKFEGMEIDDFDRMADKVKYLETLSPLDTYLAMLNKIPRDRMHTYDEKMVQLISACDPDFYTLNIFEELGKPEKDTDEYSLFETRVREQIGIFDPNLKYYEACYRRRLAQINLRDKMVDSKTKKLEQ